MIVIVEEKSRVYTSEEPILNKKALAESFHLLRWTMRSHRLVGSSYKTIDPASGSAEVLACETFIDVQRNVDA